jgi:hypothetical protein
MTEVPDYARLGWMRQHENCFPEDTLPYAWSLWDENCMDWLSLLGGEDPELDLNLRSSPPEDAPPSCPHPAFCTRSPSAFDFTESHALNVTRNGAAWCCRCRGERGSQ